MVKWISKLAMWQPRAGVSPATVSRVLNDKVNVNPNTKKKVLQAIEELHYVPNAAAKNLRSQKNSTIGVIVPDINSGYFAQVIKGIENMAYKYKCKVIICDSENSKENELDYLTLLTNQTVDGMILNTSQLTDEEIIRIVEKGYNIGVIGKLIEHDLIPCIYIDNISLSKTVVSHFVENGHKDFVFLSGYTDSLDSNERLEGYLKGLRDYKLPIRHELIENGNFIEDGGYEAMMRLLSKDLLFSAVYVANDEMALGVYKACREKNLRIPEEVAIVGVDNNRIGKHLTPTLSSVDQPKYNMGALLIENFINKMKQNEFQTNYS